MISAAFGVTGDSYRMPRRDVHRTYLRHVLLGFLLSGCLVLPGGAEPLRGGNLEGAVEYPFVFDSLLQCLNSLRSAKPEVLQLAILKSGGGELPFRVENCRETIRKARRALFCLEYFQKTLSPSELDRKHGDFVFRWVTADSVERLIYDARDFFVKNKIPFARGNEFKLPQLPK